MGSDSDFEDDDDDLLIGLMSKPAPSGSTEPTSEPADSDMRARLYKADGEVAILRAQMDHFHRQRQEELESLRAENQSLVKNQEDQIGVLRHALQSLEDERKFLTNELRSSVPYKKRKVEPEREIKPPKVASQTRVIRLTDDSVIFAQEMKYYVINGAARPTMTYLDKVYVDEDIKIKDLFIAKKTPLSSILQNYLSIKRDLRLDDLIADFCEKIVLLIETLKEKELVLATPFLASLIYFSISFRPSAVKSSLIGFLTTKICQFINLHLFLLDSNLNQDDFAFYHDVPVQVMLLEKFFLICCMDIMEKLVSLSEEVTLGPELTTLFLKCLPENTERFRHSAQINFVSNITEMLLYSITEDKFGFNNHQIKDETIFYSLLKILLIDLPIKEEFMFYGLNRMIGNNRDIAKLDQLIPETTNLLNKSMVLVPEPLNFNYSKVESHHTFEERSNHEFHILNLRIRVIQLLESYVVTKQSTSQLESKEYMKLFVRTIGFEQNNIMKSPRSQHVHLRIEIISELIRLINQIIKNAPSINDLIHPETLYEIFVVFARISFGADSLSLEAFKLLKQTRSHNIRGFYNEAVEQRARDLSHWTNNNKELPHIESEFANGLEFPYDSDIIELSREILNKFVNHDEADNLYFNMNEESNFDEMDLVT